MLLWIVLFLLLFLLLHHPCIFYTLPLFIPCLACDRKSERYSCTCNLLCLCIFIGFSVTSLRRIFFFSNLRTNRKSYFSCLYFCTWFISLFLLLFFLYNLYLVFGWCLRGNIKVKNTKAKRRRSSSSSSHFRSAGRNKRSEKKMPQPKLIGYFLW